MFPTIILEIVWRIDGSVDTDVVGFTDASAVGELVGDGELVGVADTDGEGDCDVSPAVELGVGSVGT
jgi:hypothetical protein